MSLHVTFLMFCNRIEPLQIITIITRHYVVITCNGTIRSDGIWNNDVILHVMESLYDISRCTYVRVCT